MNEQFVYVKLVTGEQLMALKESEDTNFITLKFPMLVKTHLVGSHNGRISEQVTAGPYTLFTEDSILHVNKQHVVFDSQLAQRAIAHYIHLVRDHEGVLLNYTPTQLQWDDEPPPEAADVSSMEDIHKVLDHLRAIAGEEEEERKEDKVFIEGNETIH
jgi:hypothetical protein